MKKVLLSFFAALFVLSTCSVNANVYLVNANAYLYDECPACGEREASLWRGIFSRTELIYQKQSIHGQIWSLKTIQPLYQTCCSSRNTVFVQAQASRFERTEFYNIGLGYRYLSPDENWILGFNTFYDTTSKKYQQRRVGVGAELFFNDFTFRTNYYEPLSSSKTVSEVFSPGNIFTTTKLHALRGIDGEVEVPLPHMPWARVSVGGFYFKGKHETSCGFSGNLRVNITSYLQVEAGRQPNRNRGDNYVLVSLSFGSPAENEYSMINSFFTCHAYPGRCLERHTLEKVRRQNEVVVKKHSEKRVICPANTTLCNGACTNTLIDPMNCGSCGTVCPSGQCVNGTCVPGCSPGQQLCDGTCTNVQTDPNNCGTCGLQCPVGQACVNSTCTNGCTTDADCPLGELCVNGTCVPGCPSGQQLCGGVCTNVQTDPNNCGTCGLQCPSGSCVGGICVDACAVDQDCPLGEICVNGICVPGCPPGQQLCSGVCTNIQTDPNNCGSCGLQCPVGQSCVGGSCVPAGCTDDADCPVGEFCVDGACTTACTTNAQCPSGICDNGFCVPLP